MLKLKINKEPYWLELGYGVKVKVKPCNSAVFYEAKAYMNAKLADLAKEYRANKAAGLSVVEDVENPIKREALADRYLLIGLGVAGILERWRRTFAISIADCRNCWKRKKTPPRPSQMALRRRAKLLRRMLRVKSALSVPQVPIYRNDSCYD